MVPGGIASDDQVRLTLPLRYQQKVLEDIHGVDGLVILARGLGLPLVVANLLHTLNRPGALVVLLGAERTFPIGPVVGQY